MQTMADLLNWLDKEHKRRFFRWEKIASLSEDDRPVSLAGLAAFIYEISTLASDLKTQPDQVWWMHALQDQNSGWSASTVLDSSGNKIEAKLGEDSNGAVA